MRETHGMGEAAARMRMTEEEYLAFERNSEEKHEYADGEIFAMSGGSMEHSNVAANIIGELRNALAGRGCRVLTSDMRIRIDASRRYVYPDGSVVCGRAELADNQRDVLLNPRLIVEVLSESSERYYRGDKFAEYRTIPSFQEYVIASQWEPLLEVFTRQPDGSWNLRVYGPGQRAALRSLDVAIDVDRVYADVFQQPEEPNGSVSS
jgi:Uma2 family endonuclease